MFGAALEVSMLKQRDGASVVFSDRRRARLDEAQLRCEFATEIHFLSGRSHADELSLTRRESEDSVHPDEPQSNRLEMTLQHTLSFESMKNYSSLSTKNYSSLYLSPLVVQSGEEFWFFHAFDILPSTEVFSKKALQLYVQMGHQYGARGLNKYGARGLNLLEYTHTQARACHSPIHRSSSRIRAGFFFLCLLHE